jgi:hypothetical protein
LRDALADWAAAAPGCSSAVPRQENREDEGAGTFSHAATCARALFQDARDYTGWRAAIQAPPSDP